MVNQLEQFDTQIFWWVNQHHCDGLDWLLWIASQQWSWAIVLVAAFCLITLRHEPRQWWVVLLGIGLCFLLADRISVLCFKDVFCRLRPCHALEGVRMFRTSCGGQYGFISSHAANVFALALFLSLRCRKTNVSSADLVAALLCLWACIVCYSRPYLGKHYPGDVICGAAVGLLIGWIVFLLSQLIEKLITKKNISTKAQK